MTTKMLPHPKQLRLTRSKDRVEEQVLIATLVRHLAREEIKAEWTQIGRLITADPVALSNAVTAHLIQHRSRLRIEAKLILSSTEEKL